MIRRRPPTPRREGGAWGGAVVQALREVRHHPARYTAMLLAVVVAVTFLAASQISLATESQATATRSALYASRADVIIDSYVWNWGGGARQRDGALAAATAALDDDPEVVAHEPFSQVRGKLFHGERVASVMLTTAIDDPGMRWTDPVEGRLPDGTTEAMLTQETADRLDLRVGDVVNLDLPGAAPLRLVGLTRERGYGTPPAYVPRRVIDAAGAALPPADPSVIINPAAAAADTPGSSGGTVGVRLLVRTQRPDQAQAVADRTAEALDRAGYLRIVAQAKTGAQVREQAAQDAGRSTATTAPVVTAAAGVALLVGAVIIANTLTILLTQRRRQIGLLRAVGATRRQVLARVLAEAALLGIAGSLLALPLALGVAAVVGEWVTHSLDFGLVVPWPAVLAAVLLGVVITLLAAVGPVVRFTRITPLEALQPAPPAAHAATHARRRVWACGLLGAVGAGALTWALLAPTPALHRAPIGLLGGLGLALAGVVATPLYVPGLMRVLAAPFTRRSPLARVAVGDATRNPGRVGAAASALLVAVGLIVVVQVAVTGVRMAAFAELDRRYPIDISLQSAVLGPDLTNPNGSGPATHRDESGRLKGFVPGALEIVRSTRGVASAVMVPMSDTAVVFTAAGVYGLYPLAPLTPEANAALRTPLQLSDQSIGLPADAMTDLRTQPGARLRVNPMVGDNGEFEVASGEVGPGILMVTPSAFEARHTPARDGLILVTLTDPDDGDSVAEELTGRLTQDNPGMSLGGSAEQKAALRALLNDVTAVVIGLLGVAGLVAMIGVGNTLSLSVIERTREHALLRALGVTRSGLRRMLLTEAALISVISVVVGTFAGVGLGWAAARLVADALRLPAPPLTLDPVPLLVTAAVVLVAGALASVLPGRRAATITPVEALADVG